MLPPDHEGNGSAPAELPVQFERFYRCEFRSVAGLVYAITGSPAAEDIAQEAFLAALKNWDEGDCLSSYDKPGAWVRKVALRIAGRWVDRRRIELMGLAKLMARRALGSEDVFSISQGAAERADFWRAIHALPRRQREVVTLHYLCGCRLAEIAGLLEITQGTVKSHLHDARKNLTRRLGLRAEREEPS